MYVVPANIPTHTALFADGDVADLLAIRAIPGTPDRTALIAELAEIFKGWRLVREPNLNPQPEATS